MPRHITLGSVRFDPRTGELWRGVDRRACERLRPQARDLLRLLVEAGSDVVTRAEIRDRLWGSQHVAADSAINNLVAELRRMFDGSDGVTLETIPRVGYRLKRPATARARQTWPRSIAAAAALAAVAIVGNVALRYGPAKPAIAIHDNAREALEKARYLLQERPGVHADAALAELQQVIRLEPGYAPGWAWTAQAHLDRAQRDPSELTSARAAVRHALDLDDRDAIALGVAGQLALYHDWDADLARRLLSRAVAAEPGATRARFTLAMLHSLEGRHDEALAELAAARRHDPVSTLLRGELSWFLFRARRFEAALQQADEVLRLEPGHRYALLCRLEALNALGREDEAGRLVPAAMEALGAEREKIETVRQATGGRLAAYRQWYAERVRSDSGLSRSAPSRAIAAAGAGDREGFFAALEDAWSERSAFLFMLAIDPRFDAFRDDPRYPAMLHRVRQATRTGSLALLGWVSSR